MIPKELAIILIITAVVVTFFYAKMVLIWRDVMIKRSEQIGKDMERQRELRSKQFENFYQ